jgi:hypothetical protein
VSATSLTSSELYAIIRQRYPYAQVAPITDNMFNIRDSLKRLLFDLYGLKWETYFDCDNYACEAYTLANRWHYLARQRGQGNAEGVAFGMIKFLSQPGIPTSAHQINFRVTGKKEIKEFEPQTCLDQDLTIAQCNSVSFVYL